MPQMPAGWALALLAFGLPACTALLGDFRDGDAVSDGDAAAVGNNVKGQGPDETDAAPSDDAPGSAIHSASAVDGSPEAESGEVDAGTTSDSSSESVDASEAGSEAGYDGGACTTSGTTQCSGLDEVQTCGANGQWEPPTPCPSPATECMGAGICTCSCSTATVGMACANADCNYAYPGYVCALSGMPDPPAYCTPPE